MDCSTPGLPVHQQLWKESENEVAQSCSTLCNSMDCSPPDSSNPWNFPGKSTGMGCHILLKGIFLTQGSNLALPHCRQTLYCLSHQLWNLLQHMSVELMMTSCHFIFCCPLYFLPSIFPSIRVFSNESVLRIRWPKYWSFSFTISLSNEYSRLISFTIDSLDLLAVQGTLMSLLQHHSSKSSIFWCSVFFILQLSHTFMITGKTIALTRRSFVGKVMSLLFNMVSRLVIAFLPRSKCLLISWLKSPSAVILGPPKIKSLTLSLVSASICYEAMGLHDMIFVF